MNISIRGGGHIRLRHLLVGVVALCVTSHKAPASEGGSKTIEVGGTTTPLAFYLSPEEKARLEVEAEHDSKAAYRLAEYYMFTVGNMELYMKWALDAGRLGDAEALYRLVSFLSASNCITRYECFSVETIDATIREIRDIALVNGDCTVMKRVLKLQGQEEARRRGEEE